MSTCPFLSTSPRRMYIAVSVVVASVDVTALVEALETVVVKLSVVI